MLARLDVSFLSFAVDIASALSLLGSGRDAMRPNKQPLESQVKNSRNRKYFYFVLFQRTSPIGTIID